MQSRKEIYKEMLLSSAILVFLLGIFLLFNPDSAHAQQFPSDVTSIPSVEFAVGGATSTELTFTSGTVFSLMGTNISKDSDGVISVDCPQTVGGAYKIQQEVYAKGNIFFPIERKCYDKLRFTMGGLTTGTSTVKVYYVLRDITTTQDPLTLGQSTTKPIYTNIKAMQEIFYSFVIFFVIVASVVWFIRRF